MRYVAAIAAAVGLVIAVAGTAGAQTSALNRAIDEWASRNHVGIAPAVRSGLAAQAEKAVEEVRRNNPGIALARLQELVPAAVVAYLDNTQAKGGSPPLADLLEDLASSKIVEVAGAWGSVNVYPILTIVITPVEPADFVVAIDGGAYQAGLRVFRVLAGDRSVKVTRSNRQPCVGVVKVTPAGPNLLTCAM